MINISLGGTTYNDTINEDITLLKNKENLLFALQEIQNQISYILPIMNHHIVL